MAEILSTIEEAAAQLEKSVVTIGNFDGMHIGHQAIFKEAQARAKEIGALSVALTFEPHPVAFFRPEAAPPRLAPAPYKYDVMSKYGIDRIVVLEFNRELAGQSPEEFVELILHRGLKAKHVVVGKDFHFGKNRAGDAEVLKELGERYGMTRTAAEGVMWDGEVVSSTRIREAIKKGDLAAAQAMLGRPYRLYGEVEHGEARGRTLGFPMANLRVSDMAIPPDGVYATTMGRANQIHWRGVTGIGTRPTFGGGERTVETFIFDERIEEGLDLYGDAMELDFYKFLRGDRRFDSVEELIEQMERDTEGARQYFDTEGFDGG